MQSARPVLSSQSHRDADDVESAVKRYTSGEGARAVFDPVGAATFQISLQLLAPREYAHLIEHALDAATKRPAVISDIAGRFPLEQAADAYSALEKNPPGKILVLPKRE